MKKTALVLAATIAASAIPTFALAADAPAAASPLTFNIGVVSDYRYRGISQTKSSRPCKAAPTMRTAPSTPAPGCPPSSG